MNARIHKKLWARRICRGFSVPLALSHALPSFWALDAHYRRLVLADCLHRKLGTPKGIALYVARRMWAA